MWSFQNGAANPDGIIRIPSKILSLLGYQLFGSLGVSYFYLFSCLLVMFVSFFLFAKYFLKIPKNLYSLAGALFFTINPIFLGNISKIGLLLAVSMLPLSLLCIKLAFDKGQIRYLLFWTLCLNISLVHPFNFSVNALVSGIYLLVLLKNDLHFITRNLKKLLGLGVLVIALNAYFVLPIASLGTISKDAIAADTSSDPVDYTDLIDIANTGDLLTGLSLSRNVLLDYDFYNFSYRLFYFSGAFVLYVAIIAFYLRNERRYTTRAKYIFVLSMAILLLLVLMATVRLFSVDELIKVLVGLPGGWIFRSPLKWQLYVPLVIAIMVSLLLTNSSRDKKFWLLPSALALSFILLNGYISTQVVNKLLVPKQIATFQPIMDINMDHKTLALIKSSKCQKFAADNYSTMAELKQVLLSKNVQVRSINVDGSDLFNLSTYDFIMDCQNVRKDIIGKNYNFAQSATFSNGAFTFYTNKTPAPYAYQSNNTFTLSKYDDIAGKYDFSHTVLKNGQANFVNRTQDNRPTTAWLTNIFETIKQGNITNGNIAAKLSDRQSLSQINTVYKKPSPYNLYIKKEGVNYTLSRNPRAGYTLIPAGYAGKIASFTDQEIGNSTPSFGYKDPSFNYKNLVPNGSFEQGFWQEKVSNCFDSSGGGKISQTLSDEHAGVGKKSLELSSKSSLACTSPKAFPVKASEKYLVSMDYRSLGGQFAGYNITFDDPAKTSITKKLDKTKSTWQDYTTTIIAPSGAKSARLFVYAYPDTKNSASGKASYDNIFISRMPDIDQTFYLVSSTEGPSSQSEGATSTRFVNPTKSLINLSQVSDSTTLITKEAYSPLWTLKLGNQVVGTHFKINNTTNAWSLNVAELCKNSTLCSRDDKGLYSMTLTMDYKPQKAFVLGMVISGIALVGTVAGIVFLYFRKPRSRHVYKV